MVFVCALLSGSVILIGDSGISVCGPLSVFSGFYPAMVQPLLPMNGASMYTANAPVSGIQSLFVHIM